MSPLHLLIGLAHFPVFSGVFPGFSGVFPGLLSWFHASPQIWLQGYWPAQPQASPIYISLTVSGPIYRPRDAHRTPALSPEVRSGGYIHVYLVQLLPAGCMGRGGGG